jgi:ribose 5-phosphate isomerase B
MGAGHEVVIDDGGVRIALGSDERTELTDAVSRLLEERGHDVISVGPVSARPEEREKQWAQVGREVGELVANGDCATAVLFCWTGTGASIAANKVRGVRAALCTDAETAAGARTWNDANVLVMGLRLTSFDSAREMLDAWFETEPDPGESENIAMLEGPD